MANYKPFEHREDEDLEDAPKSPHYLEVCVEGSSELARCYLQHVDVHSC